MYQEIQDKINNFYNKRLFAIIGISTIGPITLYLSNFFTKIPEGIFFYVFIVSFIVTIYNIVKFFIFQTKLNEIKKNYPDEYKYFVDSTQPKEDKPIVTKNWWIALIVGIVLLFIGVFIFLFY